MSKIAVNEITDEVGTGAPAFPNGMSVTGAALTDPEITGGIYLGGTGSANYLDDYEEGTFTATFTGSSSNPTVAYIHQAGFYTKVGNLVFVGIRLQADSFSGGSGNLEVSGLPFAITNNSLFRASSQPSFMRGITHFGSYIGAHPLPGETKVNFYRQANSTDFDLATQISDVVNPPSIHFSYTYLTDF